MVIYEHDLCLFAQEESGPDMAKRSDLWLVFIQVMNAIEAALGKILQERHGLGLSDYRALHVLSRSPNFELRMQDLAAHLCLNQSSVSRMVERLERSGLTVRDLCPDDKRGVYTILTDKGRSRLESAQPDYEATLDVALRAHGCENLLSAKFATSR